MRYEALGVVHVHEAVDDWLVSEPIPVPYLGGVKLRFILDGVVAGDDAPEDFDAAARDFLSLTLADRSAATPYVVKNYERNGQAPADRARVDVRDIWKHIHPSEVMISRRHKDRKIYLGVSAECDWEREHGLQLMFRDGKSLSRVSSQDGHCTHADAHALPDSEDRIDSP